MPREERVGDFPFVISGLDQVIHGECRLAQRAALFDAPQVSMDHRVKPGSDDEKMATGI
jgi:hypothetical protein